MKILAFLVSLLVFVSCNSDTGKQIVGERLDIHSNSEETEAIVTHLDWDAIIHFEDRTIDATATWTVKLAKGAKKVVFDTDRLSIRSVTVNGEDVIWTFTKQDETLGAGLEIPIPSGIKNEAKIAIKYATPSSAKALFWASPEQTAGKEYPFMFSQSQAILARSWIPCQDSPGIRFTYTATVSVPKGMMALMSAENPKEVSPSGVYRFKMDQPIPAYLMAIAVGNIAFEGIGQRTGVYSEPEMLRDVAWEFADMDKMLLSAEKLYGSYEWGRYDVLVLPPSFPFGGMENPRLTFATPTIIAGDRSLVSLIAHELAHSWSGNLVTNKTWNDFWLNEGFTVYFEMRIMEEQKGFEYANMLANLGHESLRDVIAGLGTESADTKLKLDLKGRNPDEGMTDIAYEKGYYFLKMIEKQIGRPRFDVFLRKHFTENRFTSITTETFLANLKNEVGVDLYKEMKVDEWVYQPGLPSNIPFEPSVLFNQVDEAANVWNQSGKITAVMNSWSTHEWLRFINTISFDVDHRKLKVLNQSFKLSNSGNAEIQFAWFQLAIGSNYRATDSQLEAFLHKVGRRKFIKPLYESLVKAGRIDFAKEIYKSARSEYHAVTFTSVDEVLGF